MTRTILDAQLRKISAETVQLGTLVVTALDLALQAIRTRDLALCSRVMESDSTIDTLRFEVEQLAFRSLTLQQPLGGRNLRFLSTIPSIVTDLERIGDNAAGVTKLLTLIAPLQAPGADHLQSPPADEEQKPLLEHAITEDSAVSKILELGQEACRVLQETVRAFEQNDASAARKIWQEDDVVDVRYQLVHHDLMTMLTSIHAIPVLQQDSRILQRITYWLWIAHKLERVGDHCTNICERIVFFEEGDRTLQEAEA